MNAASNPAVPQLFPALPDAALQAPSSETPSGAGSFGSVLGAMLGPASTALSSADDAERAYAAGRGDLQTMVVERARADVALSLATAAATRTSQALSTILAMQI